MAKERGDQAFTHPTLTAPWRCSVLQSGQLQTAFMNILGLPSRARKLALHRTRDKMGIMEETLALVP